MIQLTDAEGRSFYLHPNRIMAIVRRGDGEGAIVHSDAGVFVVKESVEEVKRIMDARKKANKKRNEVKPV